ncbi:MAG: hypothetical protein WA966_09890 [Ornithinimicrobium sp.]
MSPATRMYFPLAPDQVAALLAHGLLESGLMAFAVDNQTRAADPDGDEELWEFRALQRAARYMRSKELPVVVAAADVDEATMTAPVDGVPGARSVDVPLLRADVASLHLGDDALQGRTITAADHYDDEQIDLSWFDTTELAQVVRYLSSPEETTTWTQ